MSGRFATALCCIDGRAWPAVTEWLHKNYNAVHVDISASPAMATWLAEGGGDSARIAAQISVEQHGSVAIAVAGHYDCARGPKDEATQRNHVRAAMEEIATWELGVPIIGFYVDEKWNAKKVGEL